MKSKFYLIVALLIVVASAIIFGRSRKTPTKEVAREMRERENENEEHEELPAAYLEARARYEFDMVKDPVTGKIPKGIFEQERAYARTLPVRGGNLRTLAQNTYLPAGPNNIGGRTRALAYDVRYSNTGANRVIIAGCVSGGIM